MSDDSNKVRWLAQNGGWQEFWSGERFGNTAAMVAPILPLGLLALIIFAFVDPASFGIVVACVGLLAVVAIVARESALERHLQDLGLTAGLVHLAGKLPVLDADLRTLLSDAITDYVGFARIVLHEVHIGQFPGGQNTFRLAQKVLGQLLSWAATVDVLAGDARDAALPLLQRHQEALRRLVIAASKYMNATADESARRQVEDAAAHMHDLAEAYVAIGQIT